MERKVVVVLHGSCGGRAHEVARRLRQGLDDMGHGVTVVEAEFTACQYWDGSAAVLVSPYPVCAELRTPVIVAPLAYLETGEANLRDLVAMVGQRVAMAGQRVAAR